MSHFARKGYTGGAPHTIKNKNPLLQKEESLKIKTKPPSSTQQPDPSKESYTY